MLDVEGIAATITVLGAVATIVALCLALLQSRKMSRFAEDLTSLQSQSSSLAAQSINLSHIAKSIEEGLTTRSIGEFPDYLDDLVAMIGEARATIDILVDYPGYAVISDPVNASRYLQLLFDLPRRRENPVSFNVIWMTGAMREIEIRNQFASETATTWNRWRLERLDQLTSFVRLFSEHFTSLRDIDIAKVEIDQICEMCRLVDSGVMRRLTASQKFKYGEIPFLPTIHIWVIDKDVEGARQAIFSIPALHEEAVEHGFYTRDESLIRALVSLHGRYWTIVEKLKSLKDAEGECDHVAKFFQSISEMPDRK